MEIQHLINLLLPAAARLPTKITWVGGLPAEWMKEPAERTTDFAANLRVIRPSAFVREIKSIGKKCWEPISREKFGIGWLPRLGYWAG